MIIGKSLTALGGGGLKPEITVTAKAGAVLNLHYKDSSIILQSYQLGDSETQHTFVVDMSETAYVIEDATNSASVEVLVDAVAQYSVEIAYDIRASDFTVGSVVKLIENGSPIEYIVVNQGIPSDSSRYDTSCNGTWLLRKNIKENVVWSTSTGKARNNYANSNIHSYLNGTFLNLFDENIKNQIKTVKIPYHSGKFGALYYGASGLSTKIFLLSYYELGPKPSGVLPYTPDDGGSQLSYFNGSSDDTGEYIAYLNGTPSFWWARTPDTADNYAVEITNTGRRSSNGVAGPEGVRPALVMSSDTLFDGDTFICKGVS